MSAPDQSQSPRTTTQSVQARQLVLIALCVLGLLVAAFVLPPLSNARAPSQSANSGDTGASSISQPVTPTTKRTESSDGSDAGGNGSVPGDGESFSGDPRVVTFDETGPVVEECVVALEGDRTPGNQITVHVWNHGHPLRNRQVWFNGRPIGQTDYRGRVWGRVPYETDLAVRVELPDVDSCTFGRVRRSDASDAMTSLDAAPPSASLATSPHSSTLGVATAGVNVEQLASLLGQSDTETPTTGGNRTGTYQVDGTVELAVEGKPYPGHQVVVNASIEGIPMRNASVSVDGDSVGKTDAQGHYGLRVPDDRSEQMTISVSRGDFAGTASVDVLLLRVRVVPTGLVPLPGSNANVEATIQGEPERDATVTVDGTQIGATDGDGRLLFTLPTDPGTTVQVSTRGQTATTTLWPVYASTLGVAFAIVFLFAGSLVLAFRRWGSRGIEFVAVAWGCLALVVAGSLLAGRSGAVVALAVVALGGAGGTFWYRREQVARSAGSTRSTVGALVQWLLERAVRATDALDALVGWAMGAFERLRAWLSNRPHTIRTSLAAVARWLQTLPGRVRAIVVHHVDPRVVALLALVGALLTVATLLGGTNGLLAGLALLAVVGVVTVARRRRPSGETADESDHRNVTDRPSPEDGVDRRAADRSLRTLWRTFAGWVAPDDWRHRTPVEISRAAIDRGYPSSPVVEFARIFREVEYGDVPLSRERRTRARDAFGALEAANGGSDEEGEGP